MKDDNVYLLNNTKYNFQDQLLDNVMYDNNKKGENVEKCFFFTDEILQKTK